MPFFTGAFTTRTTSQSPRLRETLATVAMFGSFAQKSCRAVIKTEGMETALRVETLDTSLQNLFHIAIAIP